MENDFFWLVVKKRGEIINKINTNQERVIKICQYKNKFRITIPLECIKKLKAKPNDHLRIFVKKFDYEHVIKIHPKSKSRKYLQVKTAIPKEVVQKFKPKKGDPIKINIELFENLRSNKLIKNGYLDILAAIPLNIENKTILIELLDRDLLKIWYFGNTKPKPIILKRFIKIDRQLGEFFGLVQAESGKKGERFSFTNKFLSEITFFIEYFKNFGVNEDWNYIIYHNPKLKEELEKEVKLLKDHLKIVNKKISLIKNKTLCHIIYNIDISSIVLRIIMITLLKTLRNYISDVKMFSKELKEFAEGFIIKDLIGDGTVGFNKTSGGLNITISEQDLDSQKDIVKILKKLGISTNICGIKINLSRSLENYFWYLKKGAFVGHDYNRKKLLYHFLDSYYTKSFYERFSEFDRMHITSFAKVHNLSYNTAQMFLFRNSKRGYLDFEGNGTYSLNQESESLIELIKNAKKEYGVLTFEDSKGD